MKKLLVIFFVLSATSSFARHIVGGEIFYQYIGPGATPGTSEYRITLRLFRDSTSGGSTLDVNANIGIFDKSTGFAVPGSPFNVSLDHIELLQKSGNIPCIVNAPVIMYEVGYYYFNVVLPNNAAGYWVTYQRCCRINGITNLGGAFDVGATYLGSIAGSGTLGAGNHNSSPQFYVRDTALVCQNRFFTLDFGASDPDGDVLTYQFCEAYTGGTGTNPLVPNPAAPPYGIVPYSGSYSAASPLGSGVTINPNTGMISGTAPAAGSYVITVCINEWRNGSVINTHRKDFILKIADCDFVAAQLPLSAVFCDDFNVSFANESPSSLIYSWHWDFGVTGILNDTANTSTPSFTYPDTGIYTVRLIVNPGDQCSDTATMRLGLYPGFFPDFNSTGICINKPTSFTDATSTTYGTVNAWYWDFGETAVNNDTSGLRNPVYTYPTTGVKYARLMVQSSKGCIDTVTRVVTIIDKPPITLAFRDTLICSIDTLQLQSSGSGTGVFSWAPNYNIISANTSNPLVYPKSTTWYKVTLDENGCVNTDSVRVRVVDRVSLVVRPDTTYCAGDGVQLYATTDGLQFSWSPALDLSDPNILNPVANPAGNTTYQLTARIGNCSSSDDVTLFPVPYPFVDAGADDIICYATQTQLNGAVIAANYFWRPQGSLSNPNILNPIARPSLTTNYILTATDTLGCPKPGFDTVIVTVRPKVKASAGRDTLIVSGQPLQLNASGGETYQWTPSTGLSNPAIGNPVSLLNDNIDSIRYKVYVRDIQGCLDSATILVKIFRTNPQIFVPTGFTPNGDGLNDVLKPIAVGIERIEYFRVFNRWGQLVFSTTINGHGWNGQINGKHQTTNTFVWMVKAIDYTGRAVFQKGTSTLIR